jgi:hypothetical protein
VFLVVVLGFAALTIDIGAMYNVRADLQRTADAAALAGAAAYTTDDMMRIRMGLAEDGTLGQVVNFATSQVHAFSGVNPTFGLNSTSVMPEDILTGWINVNSSSETIHSNPQPAEYNAVQVLVRRQASDSENANGPVQLFFAPIFGQLTSETAASAVAVFDDRFGGITVSHEGAGMLPFTIHEDAFASEMAAGLDQYGYDDNIGAVVQEADDIREIRLYPYPLSGDGWAEGDGNFGVLNIGTGNQGLLALRNQIQNGITDADMEMEVGTSDLTFHDAAGSPVTYDITGSPGLDVGLTDAIEFQIGNIVGFFLHDNVVLSGANAIYTITEIRFGRVMDIRLTGAPSQRGLYIQPATYTGGEIWIEPDAPSSGGLVGRLVLAR